MSCGAQRATTSFAPPPWDDCKTRAATTMHAASDKPTRARSAGLLGGDCGPGPAEGGRAASRSIFASCSLKRVSSSPARAICSWACASCSSARAIGALWGSIAFGVDVEFIGVTLFPPMSSDGDGRLSVGSTSRQRSVQSCPKNGRMMERVAIRWKNMGSRGDSVLESGGRPRCSRTAQRLSFLVGRRRTRFCGRPGQVA